MGETIFFLIIPSSTFSGNRKVHLIFFFSFSLKCTRLCHADFDAEGGLQHLLPNIIGHCDPHVCFHHEHGIATPPSCQEISPGLPGRSLF